MLRLDRVVKPWKQSGALNAHINLYGFWNDEVFLTKSGDLGIVLRVRGVDYESLDQAAQEYAVKRLEARSRHCCCPTSTEQQIKAPARQPGLIRCAGEAPPL